MRTLTSKTGFRHVIIVAIVMGACTAEVPGRDSTEAAEMADLERAASDTYAVAAPLAGDVSIASQAPAAQQVADPMLIRTGQAQIEVDSLEDAVVRVQRLAAELGGMIASSSVVTGERAFRQATLTMKVPAARFDDAMGGLRPIGRLESVDVQSTDVGEEFVDISARLEAARELERRLLDILRTRTGDLEDVLAVERELARVRAEIERFEGRLRYLRGRVEMSQVTVNLHAPRPLVAGTPGEHVLGTAIRQAWRNFIALLAGSIAALGVLLPVALLVGGLFWGVSRLRSRRRAAAV